MKPSQLLKHKKIQKAKRLARKKAFSGAFTFSHRTALNHVYYKAKGTHREQNEYAYTMKKLRASYSAYKAQHNDEIGFEQFAEHVVNHLETKIC